MFGAVKGFIFQSFFLFPLEGNHQCRCLLNGSPRKALFHWIYFFQTGPEWEGDYVAEANRYWNLWCPVFWVLWQRRLNLSAYLLNRPPWIWYDPLALERGGCRQTPSFWSNSWQLPWKGYTMCTAQWCPVWEMAFPARIAPWSLSTGSLINTTVSTSQSLSNTSTLPEANFSLFVLRGWQLQ
jgi:hypothetical protein